MFLHFSKVLNKDGFVFFTMKLGKAKYFKTYIEIVNLARKNGFEYVYQIGVEKKDPTMRKQSAYTKPTFEKIFSSNKSSKFKLKTVFFPENLERGTDIYSLNFFINSS